MVKRWPWQGTQKKISRSSEYFSGVQNSYLTSINWKINSKKSGLVARRLYFLEKKRHKTSIFPVLQNLTPLWIPKRHLFCVDQVAQISPGRPQMPKIGQKCPKIHNFLCIFISLYLSAFILISLHLSAFLYTSWHFSAFLSIFLHFPLQISAFLFISLHFSAFFCKLLHFTGTEEATNAALQSLWHW